MPAQILKLKSPVAPPVLNITYNNVVYDGAAFEPKISYMPINTSVSSSSTSSYGTYIGLDLIIITQVPFYTSYSSTFYTLRPLDCSITLKSF